MHVFRLPAQPKPNYSKNRKPKYNPKPILLLAEYAYPFLSGNGKPSSTPDYLFECPEFNTEKFHQTANSICADTSAHLFDKQKLGSIVNDIFQLDILLMLPGQELPMVI